MSCQRPDDWPIDWPAQAGAVDDVLKAIDSRLQQRRLSRRRKCRVAMAFCGVLLLAGGIGWVRRAAHTSADSPAQETLAPPKFVAHPESRILPDGSVMELKSGARVTVAFSATQRRIELADGEAHFEVVKDPQRPFVVEAGSVRFRAVGTVFSVQKGSAVVELFVTEGRVAVDQPTTPPPETGSGAPPESRPVTVHETWGHQNLHPTPSHQTLAIVEAGHRVVVPADFSATSPRASPIVAVTAAQVSERLAWRVPTLDLSGTPLREALPHFSRHGRVQITLADAEVARVRLSGMIRADNIETLLALLADGYGIQAERRPDGEIVLRKRR